jgi:hypothetical protein
MDRKIAKLYITCIATPGTIIIEELAYPNVIF